jgi:hypothetical protein
MEEIPFNPARRLCPDGACVGVLGPDGRCSVCGRTEAEAARGDHFETADDDSTASSPAFDPSLASPPSSDPTSPPSSTDSRFDSKRRLCDDGRCVGVVGPDGVCGTCGRKAD